MRVEVAEAREGGAMSSLYAMTSAPEAILDGTQGPEATLARLREPFPVEWDEQRAGVAADL